MKKGIALACQLISLLGFVFCFRPAAAQYSNWWKQVKTDSSFLQQTGSPCLLVTGDEKSLRLFRVVRFLDAQTAIIERPAASKLHLLNGLNSVSIAPVEWKFAPALFSIAFTSKRPAVFNVRTADTVALRAVLKANNIPVIYTDPWTGTIQFSCSPSFLYAAIVPLPGVVFADMPVKPREEVSIIGYNRSFHGISALDYLLPGANGKNRTVGVKEQKMDATDIDLWKRVKTSTLAAPNTEYHATVIASIIGGAGNSFYDARGIAWGAGFYSSNFSNLFPDDIAALNTAGVTVQNHSYGTVNQQFYGAEAAAYDGQTFANSQLIHVFSAGNRGTDQATEGRYASLPGFANLTGNFKNAKNILTIGAIDNKGFIPAESSAGPLFDGRIAPQLIALGPNGTSDAAAIVSGTIAVLQQVYADSNSQAVPPASLVKAILFNTADDAGRSGPDFKTGYGLVNSYEAVKAVQQKEYDGASVAQGQTWTRTIAVPAGTARVKVTLSWTDTAGTLNNNKAIVNDLDLELVEQATGIIYKPWVLNLAAHADSLVKIATRKRDSLNTAEQISVDLPSPGNYIIRVNGTAISSATVPFHVAFRCDTLNTFRFTSPAHTSDVNRAENANLDIRWRCFVADTNTTGNLYISYDGSLNWVLLKANHKIYTNYYSWPVKDTVSRARLRMQTGFGDFYSAEFVISPVLRPVVDYLCTDSLRISWAKHIYAGSYRIYLLADTAYLKPIQVVTDTFLIMPRIQYPGNVYAVEPILSNAIPASRSVAFDVREQGVRCFYRTLYYDLQDENQLRLVLEISFPAGTDSIYFEQTDISGRLLRTVGGQRSNGISNVYDQLVADPPGGTSYWRARIKMKSGAIVYTEIISVLTSGKKFLLVYPNPAARGNTIVYMLRQGIATSARLQLLDVSGRMVRNYTEMPGEIKTGALPPGVYLYRLMDSSGNLLETGKIILQ